MTTFIILHLKKSSMKGSLSATSNEGFLFVRSNKKTYKINFTDITYIEGLGDYIQIHLENQKIITNLSILLPEETDSIKMPATFLFAIITSLGHFNSVRN